MRDPNSGKRLRRVRGRPPKKNQTDVDRAVGDGRWGIGTRPDARNVRHKWKAVRRRKNVCRLATTRDCQPVVKRRRYKRKYKVIKGVKFPNLSEV